MKKPREVEQLAQSHTAYLQQRLDLNYIYHNGWLVFIGWCCFPRWLKNLRVRLLYSSQELIGTGTNLASLIYIFPSMKAMQSYTILMDTRDITKAVRNKMSQS